MITVARYESPDEAYLAKALLEAAEIRVVLEEKEELDNGIIFLKVDEQDRARARYLLEDQGDGSIPLCETLSPERTAEQGPGLLLQFAKGGAWAIVGVFILFLLLLPFGRLLHINWMTGLVIFIVGGLLALILRKNDG